MRYLHRPTPLLAAPVFFALVAFAPVDALAEDSDDPRRRFSAFVEAFRSAFEAQNLDAALALFYWEGVARSLRTRVLGLLDRDLSDELLRVALMPSGDAPQRWEANGAMMRNNLPVTARLLAEFESDTGSKHYSVHNLGLKDGVYYIVLARPETI